MDISRCARSRETDGLQRRMAAVQFPGKEPVPLGLLNSRGWCTIPTRRSPTDLLASAALMVEEAVDWVALALGPGLALFVAISIHMVVAFSAFWARSRSSGRRSRC